MWPRRRFHRRNPARIWIALAILLAVLALRSSRTVDHESPPDAVADHVRRVVDGDTLLMDDGTRVRLIGVDTPETKKEDTPVQPWGPEASAFAEELIGDGEVRLTYDAERAYVWVDGRLLNEELIRAGLGRAVLQYPFSSEMKRRFRLAQEEARRQRLGIWSGNSPAAARPGGDANLPPDGSENPAGRQKSPF
jgi:micrococcal nuclease